MRRVFMLRLILVLGLMVLPLAAVASSESPPATPAGSTCPPDSANCSVALCVTCHPQGPFRCACICNAEMCQCINQCDNNPGCIFACENEARVCQNHCWGSCEPLCSFQSTASSTVPLLPEWGADVCTAADPRLGEETG